MANFPKTGLTPETIKNMVFGAGVLYKNFSYGEHYAQTFDTAPQSGKSYYYKSGSSSGVGYSEFSGTEFSAGTIYYEKYTGYGGDLIGATQGGTKANIIPEYTDIEVDGVLVKMEGLTQKIGEKATIETSVLELSPTNVQYALNGTLTYSGTDAAGGTGLTYCSTKSSINRNDYINNLALVAPLINTGKYVKIIFKKALCTSGFEIDTKNKEEALNKYTFEAYAELSNEDVDTLPVQIIFDKNN